MSVYRTRLSSVQEPSRLAIRAHEFPALPASSVPGRAREHPAPPAVRPPKIDRFLWLLWAVLVLGFLGVSFVVYAVIFGTPPVSG